MGRAKCNERTAYTVLGEPNGAIAEWECNVPCVFLKNLSILFRFWWAFYYCIWFFCFEKWKRSWGWIPFFKTPYFNTQISTQSFLPSQFYVPNPPTVHEEQKSPYWAEKCQFHDFLLVLFLNNFQDLNLCFYLTGYSKV